jgi:hypothetical protein
MIQVSRKQKGYLERESIGNRDKNERHATGDYETKDLKQNRGRKGTIYDRKKTIGRTQVT